MFIGISASNTMLLTTRDVISHKTFDAILSSSPQYLYCIILFKKRGGEEKVG